MTASVRGQLGLAALLTAAGAAHAADTLPALRVDPELLGLPPTAKPAPAASPQPEKPVAPTAVPAAPSAQTSPPTPIKAQVPAQPAAVPKVATESVPVVAPVPAAVAPVAANPVPSVQAPKESPKPAPVTPPPAAPVVSPATSRQTQQQTSATTAQNMAPLRVDPALLGGSTETTVADSGSAPATRAANDMANPPTVSGAVVAPLYSAHVDAGRIPAPTGYKKVPHDPNAKEPVYITADRMSGTTDQAIRAEGGVELQQGEDKLTADKVAYWQLDEEAEAEGNVVMTRPDAHISGPKMRIRMADNEGYFEQPEYTIQREVVMTQPMTQDMAIAKPLHPSMPDISAPQRTMTTGSGKAERIDFEGEGQYRLTNATYSTCPAGDDQAWYAKVSDLKLDYDREVADGSHARIYFKDVPFLYTPIMSFSLNNQRKTGLLPATFGANSKIGFQYYQPFYWNIAPNMDATITSRLMTKRGLQLSGDLRYLDYNYSGISRFEYLPTDAVTDTSRYAYSIRHDQNFGSGFSGNLNLNGVSDSTYFTDLSTRISSTSQVNLLRQGTLNYGANWWSASLGLSSYQTLQIPDQPPIATPYARLPQLKITAARPDLPGGVAFNLQGEYVKFSHATQVLGQRTTLYPQLSLPLQNSAFYVTPKVGVSATSYSLDRQAAGTPDSITRTLPIFSVDSGVTFERDMQWRDSTLTQTLEPRLYYVYIPYRDQSNIPVFDTALADFNFAQIFSENRYVGRDRIGDANQLTAAVTSRLIDPETGVELVRGMLGQRYYFSDQRVTLPNETVRTSRDADLLAALTGLVAPKTYIDTGWQYNPRDARTERLNVMARFQPEIGKVLNAGYRYTRDLLGQIDISGQWPLGSGWSGMGRYNFSTKDNRVIEAVAGLEYNGGCWAIRGLLQRLSTTAQTETTSFFIQLELSGFSNIGSNPADVLRRTIPGYSRNYGQSDPTSDGTLNYY